MSKKEPWSGRSAGATIAVACMSVAAVVAAGGCADSASAYPSAEGKAMPYILKDGCTFAIVGEYGRSSISSPKVTGIDEESVSASISFGEYSITVSSCAVVENSHGLPIYEE